MNTIQIKGDDGFTINYSENDIKNIIQARETWKLKYDKQWEKLGSIQIKVRDFFSESEWDDDDFSTNRAEVNELLESCGINKLTREYCARIEIVAYVNGIQATDEDDLVDIINEYTNVSISIGELDLRDLVVSDIETE